MSREPSPDSQSSRPWPRSAEIDSLRARFPEWVIERDDRPSPPRWSAVAHGFAFTRLASGGATLTELARHLDITRQAAAEMVEELVGKGYVERRPHPDDGRAKLIVLTQKGWACARAAEAATADALRSWAEALGEPRLRALTDDLARVAPGGPLRPLW